MTDGPWLPVFTIRVGSDDLDPCDQDATPEADFDVFLDQPGFASRPPIHLVWAVSSGA